MRLITTAQKSTAEPELPFCLWLKTVSQEIAPSELESNIVLACKNPCPRGYCELVSKDLSKNKVIIRCRWKTKKARCPARASKNVHQYTVVEGVH
jgi:hypothetical protein